MATKHYTTEEFEREFAPDVRGWIEDAMLDFHREMHAFGGEALERHTPRDETPEMVRRYGDRIDRADSVPASPRANLGRINKLGVRSARINTDGGFPSINAGRKRNFYPGWSRMGGSDQAPRGMTDPAREETLNASERLGAEAIALADRKWGR